MTKYQRMLCECVYHITVELDWMINEGYIISDDCMDAACIVSNIAEAYMDKHSEGDEEDYLSEIISFAQQELFDEFKWNDNNENHVRLAEIALFGEGIKQRAARYALKNNVSMLDYDWWTHAMEIMEYEISYHEYAELSDLIDKDFMELDITDSSVLLRLLLDIRKACKNDSEL